MAMVSAVQEPGRLKNAWLSLLAEPGTAIFKRNDPARTCALVLRSTPYGVVTWPLRPVKVEHEGDSLRLVEVILDHRAEKHGFVVLSPMSPDELNEWRAEQFNPVSPLRVGSLVPLTLRPTSIVLQHKSASALLRVAAERGLGKLTVQHLGKLMTFLKVPFEGRRPQSGDAIASCILKFVVPNLSDDAVRERVQKRNEADELALATTLLSDEHVSLAEEFLDEEEEEVSAIKQYVNQRNKSSAAPSTAASSTRAPTSAASSAVAAPSVADSEAGEEAEASASKQAESPHRLCGL